MWLRAYTEDPSVGSTADVDATLDLDDPDRVACNASHSDKERPVGSNTDRPRR